MVLPDLKVRTIQYSSKQYYMTFNLNAWLQTGVSSTDLNHSFFLSVTVNQVSKGCVCCHTALGQTGCRQETSQRSGQKGQKYQGNNESGNFEEERKYR